MATRTNEKMTGRPRHDFSRQYFLFNSEDSYSYCKIVGCNGRVKYNHCGNLEKHLRSRHPEEYARMINVKESSSCGKRQRSKSLSVSMDIDDIKNALVEMVTVNGRPLNMIDDSGFRKILEPLLKASGPNNTCALTSTTVRNLVELKAKDIRDTIRQELKNKLLSVKVDAATRHDRGFLGINAQFIEAGVIHIRTLGIIELTEKHTTEYLQLVIQTVLNEYQIPISNIYSFTSDNGANMLKLGKLFSQKQSSHNIEDMEKEEKEEDEDHIDEDNSVNEEPAADELETLEGIHAILLNESDSCQLSNGSSFISNIRCVAHTLQLAVYDALKACKGVNEIIARARTVAKALRKPIVRKQLCLSISNAKKAPLDVATRWNSTADMLQYLVEMKNFCRNFSTSYKELHLADAEWDLTENYLEALMPSKVATIRLQAEQLTLSSFYGIWIECKVLTSEIATPLALKLVKAMEKREAQLMENDALLASIYLDPRFISLLPDEYHGRAVAKLEQVWQKLEAINGNSGTLQLNLPGRATTDTRAVQSSMNSDTFRKMCERANAARIVQTQGSFNIHRLLEEYKNSAVLDLSADILQYWESKKNLMPQLYRLATVVHAAPATQVSLKRLFSGMHFIFSTLRANLKSQILDDIILIRCNHQNTQKMRSKTNISPRRQRRRTESSISTSESSNASTPTDDEAPPFNVVNFADESEQFADVAHIIEFDNLGGKQVLEFSFTFSSSSIHFEKISEFE